MDLLRHKGRVFGSVWLIIGYGGGFFDQVNGQLDFMCRIFGKGDRAMELAN